MRPRRGVLRKGLAAAACERPPLQTAQTAASATAAGAAAAQILLLQPYQYGGGGSSSSSGLTVAASGPASAASAPALGTVRGEAAQRYAPAALPTRSRAAAGPFVSGFGPPGSRAGRHQRFARPMDARASLSDSESRSAF